MKLRSRVNVVLAERRMTKRQLEKKLGISHSTLWRWTTDEGIRTLSLAKLELLANALGCDAKDLFEE